MLRASNLMLPVLAPKASPKSAVAVLPNSAPDRLLLIVRHRKAKPPPDTLRGRRGQCRKDDARRILDCRCRFKDPRGDQIPVIRLLQGQLIGNDHVAICAGASRSSQGLNNFQIARTATVIGKTNIVRRPIRFI